MANRPPIPSVILSRRMKIVLSVVGILIVLVVVAAKLTGTYINWLWFGEVGYRQVYTTVLWTRLILFLIFGTLMALILGANLVVAYLLRPPFRPMSAEQQNLQHYVLMIEPRRRLVLAGVLVIALFSAGTSAQGKWSTWLLWLHGGPFGVQDPQFHRDISFYAWDYPVYRAMLGFGFTAILFSLLLTVGVHYLSGAIRLQTPGPKITVSARRHITVLVFIFMALKAVAYWLDRYGFMFSSRSKFTGASYTDVHAALPAKMILFYITIILALGVLASMWLRSALLPGIGFIVLMVLSVLIGGIYPSIVQHVSVNPNASDKEAPYIQRNIDATRQAYGIVTDNGTNNGTVKYVTYNVNTNPATSAITNTDPTVANIRITDPNVVSPTVTNAQRIRQVYGFAPNLDIDRYTIGNTENDYVVGVREAVPSNLTGSSNNWINVHTVYTHGYGFVAAKAGQDITQQDAKYTEGDIPPAGPLTLTKQQIYYGELMTPYSIVGALGGKPRESDATGATTITYDGKGGVPLSNPLTKLAFAIHYKSTNFLLNDAVSSPGAKVIFNRSPRERVQKVAPFLTVDGDPYPAVVDGRVVWIVDAYTTMANYPYSERQSLSDLTHTSLNSDQRNTQINYIRNSVKVTVDAYDGTVNLYNWDPSDPVLQAWMKIFPGLIKPASAMPADVRAHIRYPQDLFDVQRALLAQYHVDNPVTFYNGRDRWAVPADPFQPAAGDQPPYYVLAAKPDSQTSQPQFQLTSPMLVNNSPNLAAYVSADSDPGPNYGKITVLTATDAAAVQGPSQVANVFKTQSTISKDISLFNTGQSQVVHGNLLTLPLGGSFLYVEPLYVQSVGGFPTLQRVLVTYGNNIGYGANLADALGDIQNGRLPGATLTASGTPSGPGGGNGPPSTPPPTTSPPPGGSTTPPTTQAALLAQVSTALDDLSQAYQSGNFTRIGRAQTALQQLLTEYQDRYGAAPSGTATPTPPKPSPTR